MLILSRKKHESIIIGDNINVVVVEIRGDKVRLGVEAPPEMPANRSEVYEAIVSEGKSPTLALRTGAAVRLFNHLAEDEDRIESLDQLDQVDQDELLATVAKVFGFEVVL